MASHANLSTGNPAAFTNICGYEMVLMIINTMDHQTSQACSEEAGCGTPWQQFYGKSGMDPQTSELVQRNFTIYMGSSEKVSCFCFFH